MALSGLRTIGPYPEGTRYRVANLRGNSRGKRATTKRLALFNQDII